MANFPRCLVALFVLVSTHVVSVMATKQEPLGPFSEYKGDAASAADAAAGEGGVDGNTSLHIHEHWMRYANTLYAQLTPSHNPCPFNAFAAVVVNHSASTATHDGQEDEYPLGRLVCTGVNGVEEWGNPTLHGEIAAINNCSRIFQEQARKGGDGVEALDLRGGGVWKDLTIYSTAEPCPMCASAIRWTGFKEVVFATTRTTMLEQGWPLIGISTKEVFARSGLLEGRTRLLEGVLANETDAYFAWQYDAKASCPTGCVRKEGEVCARI